MMESSAKNPIATISPMRSSRYSLMSRRILSSRRSRSSDAIGLSDSGTSLRVVQGVIGSTAGTSNLSSSSTAVPSTYSFSTSE